MSFFREEIEGMELVRVGEFIGGVRIGGWGGVMVRERGIGIRGDLLVGCDKEFNEGGLGEDGILGWVSDHFRRLGVLEGYWRYVRMDGYYGYMPKRMGGDERLGWMNKRMELLRRLKLMRMVLEHGRELREYEEGRWGIEGVERMRGRMRRWFLRCGWDKGYSSNRRFQIMAFHSIRPALMKYFEDRGLVGKAVDVIDEILSDNRDDVKMKSLKFEVSKEVLKMSGAYAEKASVANTTVVSVLPDMMSKLVSEKKNLVLEMRREQDDVETLALGEGSQLDLSEREEDCEEGEGNE